MARKLVFIVFLFASAILAEALLVFGVTRVAGIPVGLKVPTWLILSWVISAGYLVAVSIFQRSEAHPANADAPALQSNAKVA